MKRHGHRERLDRLTDELVEDVLTASDEDILSESDVDFPSVTAEADHVRALLGKAQVNVGKRLMQKARASLDQQKTIRSTKVLQLDPLQARRKLESFLSKHPEAATRELTLAARKGTDLTDSDVMSMLEDLLELGLFNDDPDTETEK